MKNLYFLLHRGEFARYRGSLLGKIEGIKDTEE